MSTIINTRSPFYRKISNASLSSVKLELYIFKGTYSSSLATANRRYTLKKDAIGNNTYVTFELSKLIRDYMETEYNNYSTDSLWVQAAIVIYNASGTSISSTVEPYLAIDGYGYFENGINPRSVEYTTPMLLQDNTTIYYSDGQDIKIPIYAEAATITATLSPSVPANNVKWDESNVFWDVDDGSWNAGGTTQSIIDNGNTNQ